MGEFVLRREPALGAYSRGFDQTRLTEVLGANIAVVSIPVGSESAFRRGFSEGFRGDLPTLGGSLHLAERQLYVLRTAADRLMSLRMGPEDAATDLPVPPLVDMGYWVDHSHCWVVLKLEGPLCDSALERLCAVDLHLSAFPPGCFARTKFENIPSIVFRIDAAHWILMAPRSFAHSFVELVEVSLRYVMQRPEI